MNDKQNFLAWILNYWTKGEPCKCNVCLMHLLLLLHLLHADAVLEPFPSYESCGFESQLGHLHPVRVPRTSINRKSIWQKDATHNANAQWLVDLRADH